MSYHQTAIQLRVSKDEILPPNKQWENRFQIRSESSNRIYVIAQNIKGRFWGCSCPGWRTRRYCKHLKALGLPINEVPMEVELQ